MSWESRFLTLAIVGHLWHVWHVWQLLFHMVDESRGILVEVKGTPSQALRSPQTIAGFSRDYMNVGMEYDLSSSSTIINQQVERITTSSSHNCTANEWNFWAHCSNHIRRCGFQGRVMRFWNDQRVPRTRKAWWQLSTSTTAKVNSDKDYSRKVQKQEQNRSDVIAVEWNY